jgi:hypothetical protein
MRRLRIAFAVAGAFAYLAAPPVPLRVLRATPVDEAARTATIAITFDRPVVRYTVSVTKTFHRVRLQCTGGARAALRARVPREGCVVR